MILKKLPGRFYAFLYSIPFVRKIGLSYKCIMFANICGKWSKNRLNDESKKNEKYYKHLVCLNGFTYTGSGAVADYLKEFSSTTVLNNGDAESGKINNSENTTNNFYSTEIMFITCPFSAFNIERSVCSKNKLSRWLSLKIFYFIMNKMYKGGGLYGERFYDLTNIFMNDVKTVIKKEKYITTSVYRKIASKYYINFLHTIPSNDYLVLDQVTATEESRTSEKLEYLGGPDTCKIVSVYRDVRDVYASAVFGTDWTPPHDNVRAFVKWYKVRGKMINSYFSDKKKNGNNMLLINFRDLVLNYEETTKKIDKFLGLNDSDHIYKGECFIPDVSKKNIGLYKTLPRQEDITYIEKHLPNYCFDKDE